MKEVGDKKQLVFEGVGKQEPPPEPVGAGAAAESGEGDAGQPPAEKGDD